MAGASSPMAASFTSHPLAFLAEDRAERAQGSDWVAQAPGFGMAAPVFLTKWKVDFHL